MKEVAVMMTMDCEPTKATSHPTATGPRSWEDGEAAVRGYWEAGKARGFPITYFIHPETAIGQPELFKQLEKEGACLGLHMHPWKYSVWRHNSNRFFAHYGDLSVEEQRALLAECAPLWSEAIGHAPLYFRPGTFSANDGIFKVLTELGFRGGSCSAPGRAVTEMRAIWSGAEPDPHRAHAEFRQIRGDLEFVNVPLTMDFSQLLTGRSGRRMYADLRPDIDWPDQYGVAWDTIAHNILAQLAERAPAVPVVTVITHNHYDYFSDQEPAKQRLAAMLDALESAAAVAQIRLVGTTLDQVVDAVLASPALTEPFVCEGGIFEKSVTPPGA